MSWSSEEALQVGRMEQKLNDIAEDNRAYARRLTTVEVFMHRVKGAAALLTAVASIAAIFFISGCASLHVWEYDTTGKLKRELRSTVLGTGETELVAEGCPTIRYSTRDTGLSNNGKEALGVIAEGAARGAVGAMLPSPGLLRGSR